jgi:hypothetical protein
MLHFYGLTNQQEHLNTVVTWLIANGMQTEIKYCDVNEDAKNHVTQHGFTVFPVLFDYDAGGNVVKFAEGGDIMTMSADTIAKIKASQAPKS